MCREFFCDHKDEEDINVMVTFDDNQLRRKRASSLSPGSSTSGRVCLMHLLNNTDMVLLRDKITSM